MFGTGFPDDWSALKRLIWLRLKAGGGEPGEILSVTGISPLVLQNALANHIHSLTQYGKLEQRNLPSGYTELDYIQSDGSQYIDLNTTLDQDDVIEIEFALTSDQNSRNIFGYRAGASSNNIMLFLGGTNNRVFIDFNNSNYSAYRLSYDCVVGTKYKAVISKSRRAFIAEDGTLLAESTTLCEDTIACPSAYLFHASGTPAYSNEGLVKIYSCVINGKRNLVGAKDASDVIEMYDKVTDAPFANAGTGSFTAGPNATPTPSAPMGIWTNNGVLRYSANMANVNAQTAAVGYYISSQGVVTADTMNWFYQAYIPVKPNTTYTLSFSTPVYYVTISEYSTAADSGFIVRKPGGTGGNTSLTITTEANTNFIRFGTNIDLTVVTLEEVLAINWMLNIGDTAMDYQPYVEGGIYTAGTPEVLTVSGENIFNTANLQYVANKYLNDLGEEVSFSGTNYTKMYFLVDPSTNYTLDGTFSSGGTYGTGIYFFDVDKNLISRQTSTGGYPRNIMTPANCHYVDIQYRDGVDTSTWQMIPYQIATDIPTLLAVGDYKDEAELIAGIKTGKVGVNVFDGTENWTAFQSGIPSGVACYSLQITGCLSNNVTGFGMASTHFKSRGWSVGFNELAVGDFKRGGSTIWMYFCVDASVDTVDKFKTYLAEQYAAGTPVMVFYPLATETTEQTTPHALTTAQGINTATANTNVNPVTLACEYWGIGA